MSNEILLLLETPTQVMNAYELMQKRFKRKKHLIVIRKSGGMIDENINKILNYFECKPYKEFFLNKRDKNFFNYAFIIRLILVARDIKHVIIGDVRPLWIRIFLYFYSGKAYIIDDGDITLSIYDKKEKYLYHKNIKYKFFTSFITKCPDVIENDYCYLKSKVKKYRGKSINLFIGSAYSESNVVSYEYEIKSIIDKLSLIEGPVIYFTHPRDSLKKKNFLKDNGITIINNEYPLELYLLLNGYKIDKLFGFYSSALITISRLFDVYSKKCFKFESEKINIIYRDEIECSYLNLSESGFEVESL